MPQPNLPLTPHQLPQELLDLVMEHTPDSDLPPLVGVNSAFYLGAKPCLFRRIHLSNSLAVVGPNHSLGDRDVGESFGSLDTPRPLFRNAWLSRTHTLRVEDHWDVPFRDAEDDKPLYDGQRTAENALRRQLPPLPRLRVFHSPFMPHDWSLGPWGADAYDHDYECRFLELPFKTLVHHDVNFNRVEESFIVSPEIPAGLRVEKHVLVFETNFPSFESCVGLCSNTWISGGSRTLLSDDIVLLFPFLDFDATVPGRVAEDGDIKVWFYGMTWALVDILSWVLPTSSSSVMVVGGFLDPRSVLKSEPRGVYGQEDVDFHHLSGPFGDTIILEAKAFSKEFVHYLAAIMADDDESLASPSDTAKTDAAIMKKVDECMSRLSFKSLADVQASGELDDILSPAEWRRINRPDEG